MRELRGARIADAVPDRPHTADARAHPVIDGDPESIRRQSRLLDPGEIRDAAGAQQHLVAFEALLLPVDLGDDREDRARALHRRDLRARPYLDAARLQRAHEEADKLGIGERDRLREHLEHGHLAPDFGEERAELHAHRPGADHQQAPRDLSEGERAHVVERLRGRQALDRRDPNLRAGRDDHRARVDRLFAGGGADLQLPGRHEGALALDEIDLPSLEQRLDPRHELRHDAILPRDRLREIEARSADLDAVLVAVGRQTVRVARVEQRFRGDAADGHARAADAVTLDQCDLRSLYAGVQRGDVATRTSAEDRDVVWRHYRKSVGASDASRSSG